jgi:transposase-like protein
MEQAVDGPHAQLPSLTVAALARRLGVAPATLRTWDRRYGVGPSGHSAGAHRRYTPTDVQRLEQMRRLTLEGVAPGEAARVALAGSASLVPTPQEDSTPTPVVPPTSTDAAVRGLTRAALALDARSIDKVLVDAFGRHGVLWTWDALLIPVLAAIGERWADTGNGIDVEHLMAETVLGSLRSVMVAAPEPQNARPVILASAPEELHTLPLHALAAALAERGIDSRVLGARVPGPALAAAVRRGGASGVFIWAHRPEIADLAQVEAVPAMRPPVRIVVGGPGWQDQVPPGTVHVSTLSEAVTVLQRAAGR